VAEPAASPDDDLFPSGAWTGFYLQGGARFRQDLDLTFQDGVLRGSGGDGIGAFTVQGHYDRGTLEVTWTKSYRGAHSVWYRGFREGRGIWGTWRLFLFHGGFQIWPRRAGQAEAAESAAEAPESQPMPSLPRSGSGSCIRLLGWLPYFAFLRPRTERDRRMEQSLPQELVKQVAGSFRLTALLQKRVRELVRGQKPLFETRERNYIKIASEELKRGLIELVPDEDATPPNLVL
jgi:DNA-directed RNA polymerase subunit K/omega